MAAAQPSADCVHTGVPPHPSSQAGGAEGTILPWSCGGPLGTRKSGEGIGATSPLVYLSSGGHRHIYPYRQQRDEILDPETEVGTRSDRAVPAPLSVVGARAGPSLLFHTRSSCSVPRALSDFAPSPSEGVGLSAGLQAAEVEQSEAWAGPWGWGGVCRPRRALLPHTSGHNAQQPPGETTPDPPAQSFPFF